MFENQIQIDREAGLASRTAIKGPCYVATGGNITLAGEQTIDGVAVVADKRVLVKSQTDATENGIFLCSTGDWSRTSDFSRNNDIREGTQVRVTDGDANSGLYSVSTADPIVIGTSEIGFAIEAGSGVAALSPSNNLSDVNDALESQDNLSSNGTIIVAASTLILDNADGDWIDVSGNVGISGVTLAAGKTRNVRFTGIPIITVGASLIGNGGGSNIQIAAGDRATFRGYASGVVRFWVARISGKAVVATISKSELPSEAALLDTEDQVLTGGVRVTSKSLGTISSGTVTPDPGDRPLQHYTNNGAHTLSPHTSAGSIQLDITNGASAGAISTSGFTKKIGVFTTTNGDKFRCTVSIGNAGSLLTIQPLQ